MSVRTRIAAMDRSEVDTLLHVALLRIAFIRHTDASYELGRLLEQFSHDEYERADVARPVDSEVTG